MIPITPYTTNQVKRQNSVADKDNLHTQELLFHPHIIETIGGTRMEDPPQIVRHNGNLAIVKEIMHPKFLSQSEETKENFRLQSFPSRN